MTKQIKNDKILKCPICHGTGFHGNGEFCPQITGKKDDKMPEIPKELRDIFGDIFKDGGNDKK